MPFFAASATLMASFLPALLFLDRGAPERDAIGLCLLNPGTHAFSDHGALEFGGYMPAVPPSDFLCLTGWTRLGLP
jgi:hypothetical protein